MTSAVKVVSVWIFTFDVEVPLPLIETVVAGQHPRTKLVPVTVTDVLVPGRPVLGFMEMSVGVASRIVNSTGLVVPFGVVTVTLRVPGGTPCSTEIFAVIVVSVCTTTFER